MLDLTPQSIDIDSPTSPLKIIWEKYNKDSTDASHDSIHESIFELSYLRRICPCAECSQHGRIPLETRLSKGHNPVSYNVKSIKEVGSYAIQIIWADGHSGGLYSYSYLIEQCPCSTCKPVENWEI